jgi:hypothetical protein
MTEQERVRLEIDKETKIGVAEAWSKGVAQMKLPATLMVGGNGGASDSPVDALINLLTIEKAKKVSAE